MDFIILFPCEPFNIKKVDETYLAEKNACDLLGIKYFYFNFDEFVNRKKFISNIDFKFNATAILRSWMFLPQDYKDFYDLIDKLSYGRIKLINNHFQYNNCHCFPNVYSLIKDYTPEIIVFDKDENDDQELKIVVDKLNRMGTFIIKDFVKSTKSVNGINIISTPLYSTNSLKTHLKVFKEERGKLFTNGFVFKKYVTLKKYENNLTNEWRVFYLYGKPMCYFQNSYLNTDNKPMDNLFIKIGKLISHTSDFLTIDFALTGNDEWIVIETGDGQVSGLTDGEEINFYNNFYDRKTNV